MPIAAASNLLPYTRIRRGSNVSQLPIEPLLNSAPTKLAPIRKAAKTSRYDTPSNCSGITSAKTGFGFRNWSMAGPLVWQYTSTGSFGSGSVA